MVVTYKHIDEMKPWSDKLQLLECISVTPETPDVMTFLFRSEDQNGSVICRASSSHWNCPWVRSRFTAPTPCLPAPSRPYALSVTVKAQATSIGTRWMFDNLKPGMKIRALGPLGDFSYVKHPGDKYLFISAGSGVTPMMSMVRDMSDRAPQRDIAFINCSRTPGDIVSGMSWNISPASCRTCRWLHCRKMRPHRPLVRPERHGRQGQDRASGARFHGQDRLLLRAGTRSWPAVRSMLDASGFDMSRFHQESFAPAAPVSVGETVLTGADGEALSMVGFTLSGKELGLPARADGADDGARRWRAHRRCLRIRHLRHLPVLKLSGEVEMNHNGGILDEEIEEGYILACCSRPLTDVKVEADANGVSLHPLVPGIVSWNQIFRNSFARHRILFGRSSLISDKSTVKGADKGVKANGGRFMLNFRTTSVATAIVVFFTSFTPSQAFQVPVTMTKPAVATENVVRSNIVNGIAAAIGMAAICVARLRTATASIMATAAIATVARATVTTMATGSRLLLSLQAPLSAARCSSRGRPRAAAMCRGVRTAGALTAPMTTRTSRTAVRVASASRPTAANCKNKSRFSPGFCLRPQTPGFLINEA